MQVKLYDSYKTITADEGFVLTTYTDNDDISTYSYARLMIAPLTTEIDDVREITIEEHNVYQERLEEYLEELNKI